jgi:hypothetical protein
MPARKTTKKNDVLTYKGKPIIRKGKKIFYGNLEDKYILVLICLESEPVGDIQVAKKVRIELQGNTGLLGTGRVYRQSERDNLYSAFDVGAYWLQDALEED